MNRKIWVRAPISTPSLKKNKMKQVKNKKYFGDWEAEEDMWNEFQMSPDPLVKNIIVANYESSGYDGTAYVLFEGTDDELYEVESSHCSCNGIEWEPCLTSINTLDMKKFFPGTYGYHLEDDLIDHVVNKAVKDYLKK